MNLGSLRGLHEHWAVPHQGTFGKGFRPGANKRERRQALQQLVGDYRMWAAPLRAPLGRNASRCLIESQANCGRRRAVQSVADLKRNETKRNKNQRKSMK
eukprot:scaffold292654_cov17-Prasinocladus_malaysianus.AAC.1